MRHTHVLKLTRRTVTVTIDEWPDLVYFVMTPSASGCFNDGAELTRLLLPILLGYDPDPRELRLYDGVTAGDEACGKGGG